MSIIFINYIYVLVKYLSIYESSLSMKTEQTLCAEKTMRCG